MPHLSSAGMSFFSVCQISCLLDFYIAVHCLILWLFCRDVRSRTWRKWIGARISTWCFSSGIWLCICICICTVTQLTSLCICIPIASTSKSQLWPDFFAGTCRRSTARRRCMATSPRSWPSSSTCWPTATNSPASASRKPSINRVMKKTLPAWKWYLRLPACPQALMSGRKWPEDRYRVYLYIVDRLTKPFDGRPINSHIYIVMYHHPAPQTPLATLS